MRNQRRRIGHPDLHVAGDQVKDRRPAAAILHGLETDARQPGKPLDRHVTRVDSTSGREAESGLLFCQCDQFGERVDAKRGLHGQDKGLPRQLNDRIKSFKGSVLIL